MKKFSLEFPRYCGKLWKEVKPLLEEEGLEIEEHFLQPSPSAQPLGNPRVIFLKKTGENRIQAILSFDNYLSEKRPPRSQDAFFLVYGE